MNFVSPRKLSRITNYDAVLNDLLLKESDMWEFATYLELPEETVSEWTGYVTDRLKNCSNLLKSGMHLFLAVCTPCRVSI